MDRHSEGSSVEMRPNAEIEVETGGAGAARGRAAFGVLCVLG